MKQNEQGTWKLSFYFLLVLFLGLYALVVLNVYMFAGKDTSQSYSVTRKWKDYYSIDNWNLPGHAITDIDGDGSIDALLYPGCVFLSGKEYTEERPSSSCSNSLVSTVTQMDAVRSGQELVSQSNKHSGLRKSYLVKTNEDEWLFYELNGMFVQVFRLNENFVFERVQPKVADYVDASFYFLTHIFAIVL